MSGTIILKDNDGTFATHIITADLVIKPEQYLNFDETVKSIFNEMNVEDLTIMKAMKMDNLISLHSGLGMWIRNQYGLWHEDNPLTNSGLYDKHPDGVSFKMIEHIWERLQQVDDATPIKSEPFVL